MWNEVKRWWATEGALMHLRGLDDRLLADIGLTRDDLQDRMHGRADTNAATPITVGASVCDCG